MRKSDRERRAERVLLTALLWVLVPFGCADPTLPVADPTDAQAAKLRAAMRADLRQVVDWRLPEGTFARWEGGRFSSGLSGTNGNVQSWDGGLSAIPVVGFLSFPRTGSTWMRLLLEKASGQLTETVYCSSANTTNCIKSPWSNQTYIGERSLEAGQVLVDEYAALPVERVRRVVKSHCSNPRWAAERFDRIIRPFRDPVDTLTSYCRWTVKAAEALGTLVANVSLREHMLHSAPDMARHIVRWNCGVTIASLALPTANVEYEQLASNTTAVLMELLSFVNYHQLSDVAREGDGNDEGEGGRDRAARAVQRAIDWMPPKDRAHDIRNRTAAARDGGEQIGTLPLSLLQSMANVVAEERKLCIDVLESLDLATWDEYVATYHRNVDIPWRTVRLYDPC